MTNIRRSAHALANSPSSEGRTTGCGHLPLSSRPRRLSKRRALHHGFGLSGNRGRARTFNLRINGPLLYQLRYTTLVREEGFEPPETRCRRFYGPVAYSRMATGAGIEPAASSSSHSRSTGELHRSRGLLGLKFSGGRQESNLHLPFGRPASRAGVSSFHHGDIWICWQGWWGSNPQPSVLETGTAPRPHPCD